MSSYVEKQKSGDPTPQQLDNATFTRRNAARSQLPVPPRPPNARAVSQPMVDIILEAIALAIEQAFANAMRELVGDVVEQVRTPLSERIALLLAELERHRDVARDKQQCQGPETKLGVRSGK